MDFVRPLFVSTYTPEECGLATYTKEVADAVDLAAGQPVCSVAAIQRTRTVLNQDPRVVHVIDNRNPQAYSLAGELANDGPCDVVSLQHDFDLYPDEWGGRILEFTRICKKPLVTTFHTLPQQPETLPRMLVQNLAATSQGVVVMTEGAVQLLKEAYGVSGSAVQVIPHGVPEVAFQRDERLKGRLGQAGKKVICTFGLLSRSKGIEYMIRAMPHIVAACPEAVYWIVGVTHPQVKRQEGEIYREELMDLVESLGVRNHVRFVNKYLGTAELLAHLQASDIFVTPYVGEDQISSGPMACAMSAVGAVISTPYLFAKEVLADGRGLLIPFADSQALAEAALKLLTDPALLLETRRKTYQFAKSMVWPLVGQQYLECFTQAAADQPYRTSLPPSGRILRREFSPRGM